MLDSTRRGLLLGAGALAATPQTTLMTSQDKAPGSAMPAALASVRDFGAIGDGNYRPLRDRYATLAAARARYPFVSSLAQSVDYAAIQAALDAAASLSGTVYLPAGRYIISDTLLIPSYVGIEGESWWGTIIDNQNHRIDAPQFANKDPLSFIHVTMRNLTGHGGTHFLKVDAKSSCSYNRFEGLNTNLQSISDFAFNRLEVSRFNDCTLLSPGSGYRIDVQNFPCNANTLTSVRMAASGEGAIRLRGGELWLMLGGSIESGGSAGKADITLGDLPYFHGARFTGVYFESGNEYALRAAPGASGIVFEGCHFTGASSPKGFAPPRFEAGGSIVEFAGNDFSALRGKVVRGTAQMLVQGHNDGLLTTDSVIWERLTADSGAVRGQLRQIANALPPFEVLRFTPMAAAGERPMLYGSLRISIVGRGSGGPESHEATVPLIAELGRDNEVQLHVLLHVSVGPIDVRLASAVIGADTVLRLAVAARGKEWSLTFYFDYQHVSPVGAATIAVSAH